jgi:hypothetical protein
VVVVVVVALLLKASQQACLLVLQLRLGLGPASWQLLNFSSF